MLDFLALLNALYFARSTKQKMALLLQYLQLTPDPDRGWAIAILAGQQRLPGCRTALLKTMIQEQVDPFLFQLSYDYVVELSETIAHLWPLHCEATPEERPSLETLLSTFAQLPPGTAKSRLSTLLSTLNPAQRWALIKLCTGGLRIGMSARNIKHVLAQLGKVETSEIEELWHALTPPYQNLFAWLEGRSSKPVLQDAVRFFPVMLSHPVDEEDLASFLPTQWQIEYKFDGIRVQWVSTPQGCALFTRTGDDISASFPELILPGRDALVLDAELLVIKDQQVQSFNALQQRLNKQRPSSKHQREYPCKLMLYDLLQLQGKDLRPLPLRQRREHLDAWYQQQSDEIFCLSPRLSPEPPSSPQGLTALYQQACAQPHIEGLMLKRLDSPYLVGRVKGHWFKWKRHALTIDAVIMYAQRGHGKRSSYYSDFTFGAWHEGQLLPIGKAYSGFTDEELLKLDRWVRRHSIGRFGPVKEVEKTLVVEVACDAVYPSKRHKSGVALRFPRFHRIRWDKPAAEADSLEQVVRLINHTAPTHEH